MDATPDRLKRDFERIGAAIHRQFAGDAQVTENERIVGTSGRLRQIDGMAIRNWTVAVLLVVLHLFVLQQAGAVDANYLIVPRVGIGPIKIGMPLQSVITLLGQPSNRRMQAFPGAQGQPPLPASQLVWRDAFSVTSVDNVTVKFVAVSFDQRFQTASGLHTGSLESEVIKELGQGSFVQGLTGHPSHHRKYCGITFLLDDAPGPTYQRVVSIAVDNYQCP